MNTLQPGTIVDRYAVQGLLGRGGMAAVYHAVHRQLGTHHALKVLALPSASIQARLLREGRLQGQLRHPNIVAVTDVVEVQGAPGLVMELVDGPSVKDLLDRGRPTLEQADSLARGILAGVAMAHAQGLVHRDLKPGNLLISLDGPEPVPMVTDFGLAKVLTPDASISGTRSGIPLGTPSYMAPEQIRSASTVTPRADVFALGCVLYELVTGVVAFPGEDMLEIFDRVRAGDVDDPRSVVPTLPDRMAGAIQAALQRDPLDRPADAQALLELWEAGTEAPRAVWSELDRNSLAMLASSGPQSVDTAPSDPTFEGGFDTEPSVEPRAQSPSPVPVVSPAGRRPLLWVGLAALALVAGALGSRFAFDDKVSPSLSVEGVPATYEDVAIQEALDDAWRAILKADFQRAEVPLQVVAASAGATPRDLLLKGFVNRMDGRPGSGIRLLWAAVDKAERGGAGAELALQIGRVRNLRWHAEGEALVALLEAEPDDVLRFMAVLDNMPARDPRGVELARQRRDAHPQVPLFHWLLVRRLLVMEKVEEATSALQRGLERHPGNGALLVLLGDLAQTEGQLEQARDAYQRALESQPGLVAAMSGLAEVALRLDDRDAAAALSQAALAPSVGWSHQIAFLLRISWAHQARGEVHMSLSALERAVELAREHRDWLSAVVASGQAGNLLLFADRPVEAGEWTAQATDLATNPELPDGERFTLLRNLLYARTLVAIHLGDTDKVDEGMERLKELDMAEMNLEWLRRERAAASGDVEGVKQNVSQLPEGCYRTLIVGHGVFDAGQAAEAAGLLRPLFGEDVDCPVDGEGRFLLAEAAVILAEQAEDPVTAGRWLDVLDEHWPTPDSDLHIVKRADAVRARFAP